MLQMHRATDKGIHNRAMGQTSMRTDNCSQQLLASRVTLGELQTHPCHIHFACDSCVAHRRIVSRPCHAACILNVSTLCQHLYALTDRGAKANALFLTETGSDARCNTAQHACYCTYCKIPQLLDRLPAVPTCTLCQEVSAR
jgi:hypothetical protein